MPQLLQFFILWPLLSFIITLILPKKNEKLVSFFAISSVGLYVAAFSAFLVNWIWNDSVVLDVKQLVLFKSANLEIFIDFYFDKVTAVFAMVGAIITLLVTIFSRFYIHREPGFKRFFSTLLLFFTGYNLVIFSGNFETLFIGWEILGICSFLLIAFYRDRYLPVKNGMKVISIYRLGDICLILTMWMSHQLWHENITFFQLNNASLVQEHFHEYGWYAIFICVMIVAAAATKSAQLPFSSWLPRAMEGPTTSSAVFYGSLSVHLGVFLLLRTYPYWEHVMGIKLLIIGIGLTTSIIASGIASVQSSVKTQIAYSSITQIGLIFIEVALGFHVLALVHFTGNAFLRTYQLLVSPSVLNYLIHDMIFNYKPIVQKNDNSTFSRLKNSFYILSIKEWNLDSGLYQLLWRPFKRIGNQLHFLTTRISVVFLIFLFLIGIYCELYPTQIPEFIYNILPVFFAFTAFLLILKSFTERASPKRAWITIITAQLFITLSISIFHDDFGLNYIFMFLSGAVISFIVGYICLSKMNTLDENLDLNRFHGHSYEHPVISSLFLISCLGLVGLPFTPTFIGMDLLFSHIHKQEYALIFLMAMCFIFLEIAVLRIYARVFMGQHKKAYHPIAFRSS